MTITKATKAGTKLSWTRAAKLAEFNDTKPSKARSFLAESTEFAPLLDQKKLDKRNPGIRDLLKAYDTWLATNTKARKIRKPRASKGDPTRPVRAAAPTKAKRKYIKHGNATKTGGKPNCNTAILLELKEIQTKHHLTPQDLATCSVALGVLTDTPVDTRKL
jgi:hypothetical protein